MPAALADRSSSDFSKYLNIYLIEPGSPLAESKVFESPTKENLMGVACQPLEAFLTESQFKAAPYDWLKPKPANHHVATSQITVDIVTPKFGGIIFEPACWDASKFRNRHTG